jgi:hypothetical protein
MGMWIMPAMRYPVGLRMSSGKPSETQGASDDLNVHPQSLQLKLAWWMWHEQSQHANQ